MLNLIHILFAFTAGSFTMYEPVFGTKYDTAIVKFDPFPQRFRALCELPKKLPWWIYARASVDNSDYYILSGLQEIKPDGKMKRPWPIEPDYGTIAKISESKCILIYIGTGISDSEKMASDTSTFPLPTRVSSILAQDFVRRCIKAVGKNDSTLEFLGGDSLLVANGIDRKIFIEEIRKRRPK
jgi:hypothetical protein